MKALSLTVGHRYFTNVEESLPPACFVFKSEIFCQKLSGLRLLMKQVPYTSSKGTQLHNSPLGNRLTAFSGSLPIKVKISSTVATNVFFSCGSLSSDADRWCFLCTAVLQRCSLNTSWIPCCTDADRSNLDGADRERLNEDGTCMSSFCPSEV